MEENRDLPEESRALPEEEAAPVREQETDRDPEGGTEPETAPAGAPEERETPPEEREPAGEQDPRPRGPKKKEKETGKEKIPGADLFDLFQMAMGCVLCAVILFNCLARVTRVEGSSMENTLQDGELMIIWSLGYTPRAGDIVVLNKKSTNFFENRALVKRVIATEGQTVDIDYDTGTVYVDGIALDEPYIKEQMYRPGDPMEQGTHWEVPEDSVFVMGDNRNNSSDGRHDTMGPILNDYILGRCVVALWPPDKLGPV